MQTATVLSFPQPAQPGAIPAIPPALARRLDAEVDVPELRAMLALHDLTPRTLIQHLRALHTSSGLPAPKKPRIVKGEEIKGAEAIHAGSIWHRVAIEHWLSEREPPATRAAIAEARRAHIRADMAERAREVAA